MLDPSNGLSKLKYASVTNLQLYLTGSPVHMQLITHVNLDR
jgi:hypothetical protein